jgi:prepilin-type N-terminal cleavage/methylation domain-containing protein
MITDEKPSNLHPEPAPTLSIALERRRGQRGMTLLEILIVLVILGLVMVLLVGPRVMEMFSESKDHLAKAEVTKFAHEAFPQWQIVNSSKSCPTSLADLTKYMNSKKVKDPWGNDYVMLCGDKLPAGVKGFAVMSPGADGKSNTPDDVKSWDDGK